MGEILSSVTAALSILKTLSSVNEKVKNAEFAGLLADLSLELAKTKAEVAELLTQNTDLKIQNQALLKKTGATHELVFRGGYYYTAEGDGPFCPTCHEQEQKKVRLTAMPEGFQDMVKHTCPVCKNMY